MHKTKLFYNKDLFFVANSGSSDLAFYQILYGRQAAIGK